MRNAVSLVVVSQKRPSELERLLTSLIHQSLTNFEVIIVADALKRMPRKLKQKINFIEFHELNISRARNVGIQAAKSPIIAFCDDDATPDPYWLERITAPFYAHDIGASTGFVRGRNGISYQWKAMSFDRSGQDTTLDIKPQAQTQIIPPAPDNFIKTVGTNCAFRRDALLKVGGFDEALFYYFDDTDINLRLQEAGYATAIIPQAEVIHSYFESRGRSSNRVPKSLYNLGASTHHFLHKHFGGDQERALEKFEAHQHDRLLNFFSYGLMRARQVKRLMRDLRRGIAAGAKRETLTPLKPTRKLKLAPRAIRPLELLIETKRPTVTDPNQVPVQILIENNVRAASFQFRGGRWLLRTGRFGRFYRQERWWTYRRPSAALARAESFVKTRFLPNDNDSI